VSDAPRYETLACEELYRRLAMGEPVVVLDVRTLSEYRERHIPGSLLIPLHQLERRVREVPNSGTPVAVLCEHGIRGVSACRFLAEHGIGPLYNVDGGLSAWPGPTESAADGPDGAPGHRFGLGPSRWLVRNFGLLPKGLALDVAMGRGRNAVYLATRGFDVDGVDVDPEAVSAARSLARRLNAPIRAVVGNVEDGTYIVPEDGYDVIVVFNFLHRPLFPDLKDGVRPGGVILYETFTEDQPSYGRPTNPDYLLRAGELREVFAGWEILAYREGVEPERPGGPPRASASIVARKPGGDDEGPDGA
jgi:rhodanese-related sulfurtransferase